MGNNTDKGSFLKRNWITIVIIMQPLLDVLAYWTQSESGTASGYFRLIMMLMISAYVLFHYKSKAFVMTLIAIAAVFFAHVINCARVGYISPLEDLSYIAKVVYMPVMAACFSCAATHDDYSDGIVKGLLISAALTAAVIIISGITDTYVPTYTVEKLGTSGWVIDSNRCCHSDILSGLAVFAVYYASSAESAAVRFLVPLAAFAALITNGTTACYVTLLAMTAGFPIFIILQSLIWKKPITKEKKQFIITMGSLFLTAILIFPYTPRYKMEEIERNSYSNSEQVFVEEMNALGYDIYNMTLEEKMNDHVVHEKLTEYYNSFIYSSLENLLCFGTDRLIYALDGTINAETLGDARLLKRINASFIFEDSDRLTRFTGFEFSRLVSPNDDLENDYHAIYYYYGYIGIAAYIIAVLFIIIRIVRLLEFDFKGSVTTMNFTLLMCFFLQLGLAHFSGAMLRRPNASFYLAIVIALIYRQTALPGKVKIHNEV